MVIRDKLFYVTDTLGTTWQIVAPNWKDALQILEYWRPNTEIRSFKCTDDIVLTQANTKCPLKK